MKIYLLVIEDRHVDVEVRPYSTPGKARAEADAFLRDEEDAEEQELTQRMLADGWIFLANLSPEGDCVRIIERELDS